MTRRRGGFDIRFVVAARHRRDDLAENGVDDVLDVALVKMRILLGNALNEFRFDHRDVDPGTFGPAFP